MEFTDIQKQVLNGHLLGDGCLSKNQGCINANFRLHRSINDLDYLKWSIKHFENYITNKNISYYKMFNKKTNKIYHSCGCKTKSLPIFTEYYNKWYPEGKKIVQNDLVLTPLTIAVWFADDGNICNPTPGSLQINFATHSFTKENVKFLIEQLSNIYGINIRIKKIKNQEQFSIESTYTKTIKNIIRDIYYIFPPMERKSNIWKKECVDIFDKNIVTKKVCINCGSNDIKLYGFDINKNQKFFCKKCKKQYI